MYVLLYDVESAVEDDIDSLMNDSDNEFIAKEEITQGHFLDYTSG